MTGYQVQVDRLPEQTICVLQAREEACPALSSALGTPLPRTPFASARHGALEVLALAPNRWWLLAPMADEQALVESWQQAVRDLPAAVALVSDQFTGFSLHGADCRRVLRQAVHLDLDRLGDGQQARCAFARTSAVLRVMAFDQHYQLYVDAALTDYVERYLHAAAGRPMTSNPA